MKYDVLIIGGGPAGCAAALTLRLRGKSVLLAAAGPGALAKAPLVDNYPGVPHIPGAELTARLQAQARDAGAELREALVQRVLPMGGEFSALLGQEIVQARAVLLATGAPRARALPGEEALVGRGVSYCATCDGMLYRGKEIAVIGGWSEAAEEANFLATLAKTAYYAERPHSLSALAAAVERAPGKPLSLERAGEKIRLTTDAGAREFDGVFILRPAIALSQLLPELRTERGHILRDAAGQTSLPLVCAAGDAAGMPYQAAKAAGEGNVAALTLARLLDEKDRQEKK